MSPRGEFADEGSERLSDEGLRGFDLMPVESRRTVLRDLGEKDFILLYGRERIHQMGIIPSDKPEMVEARHQADKDFEEKVIPQMKYPDGNPKTQFGVTKPRATYTPPIPYLEYSKAHLQGALKYGPFNWRDDPVTMSTYLDAAESHIAKFRAGCDKASDTDIHELGHAMTCLSIVIDAQAYDTMIDDRWKPRDPEAHSWGNNPGKVLDDYIENNQAHIKAIREKWTGFAEKQKALKEGKK